MKMPDSISKYFQIFKVLSFLFFFFFKKELNKPTNSVYFLFLFFN